jgi:hypothetical protein
VGTAGQLARAGASLCIPSGAMARPLSERLARHTPRSCSSRSDTSPRFKPSNDASSVTSTSPSSIANWITCSPTARSLSDTRRNVRRRTPSGHRPKWQHSVSKVPHLMSSIMRCDDKSLGSCTRGRSGSSMRTFNQSATGMS